MTVVYTIAHPDTGDVFYVGATTDFNKRVAMHHDKIGRPNSGPMYDYMLRIGKPCVFTIIETCPYGFSTAIEDYWIRHYRGLSPIFNVSIGCPTKNENIWGILHKVRSTGLTAMDVFEMSGRIIRIDYAQSYLDGKFPRPHHIAVLSLLKEYAIRKAALSGIEVVF